MNRTLALSLALALLAPAVAGADEDFARLGPYMGVGLGRWTSSNVKEVKSAVSPATSPPRPVHFSEIV